MYRPVKYKPLNCKKKPRAQQLINQVLGGETQCPYTSLIEKKP
jgi:hypothetical protein